MIMRKILAATMALLLLRPLCAWTVGEVPSDEPAVPLNPTSAAEAREGSHGEDIDTHPWNPDVLHANEWPYKKPLIIATDYYGPPGEFWLRGEYYLWNLKGDRLPPLVSNGTLGQPGVVPLFGGTQLDLAVFSGGNFTGGVWFDSDYTLGFEGSYFFLAEQAVKFDAASSGNPVLARPFINAGTGQPDTLIVAAPGAFSGIVSVRVPTELQGGEANLVWNVRRGPAFSFDVIAGLRYLELGEKLTIIDNSTALSGVFTGTNVITFDQFSIHNHFYGGQVGIRVDYRWRFLVFTLTEKLALGANTADILIEGSTGATSPAGAVTQLSGGLLAQPSNIGSHSDDTFSVVNQIGIQAGWQVNDYLQLFAGYTFLYASSVVQPGELVDLTVNPNQAVGGPALPTFTGHETSFWTHGLNAGLEVRY
jgi:hypothetical protein